MRRGYASSYLVPHHTNQARQAERTVNYDDNHLVWLAIAFCISQSAMFSGLNLALFSISRLRLEAEVENGNEAAGRILWLREDANFLLCTILWGNVSVNVLLALLMESALPPIAAFVLSAVGITFFGEIMPQAYFSRNAIRVGSMLTPVVRVYQILLWPVAKPTALILDGWVGQEGVSYMREGEIEVILQKHINERDSEIGETEGRGALNFLDLDDRLIASEGVPIDPDTIHLFPAKMDLPMVPEAGTRAGDDFVQRLRQVDKSRAIITDEGGTPRIVLKAHTYLFHLARDSTTSVYDHCYRPIVVSDPRMTLDAVLGEFVVEADDHSDNIIDRDVVLFWTDEDRRIITGADILGRLLRGIARREKA